MTMTVSKMQITAATLVFSCLKGGFASSKVFSSASMLLAELSAREEFTIYSLTSWFCCRYRCECGVVAWLSLSLDII